MPRVIFRWLALSSLCAAGAFGQGNFGQIAFGGCWQTTFTLINLNTQNAASVTLSFFGDNGLPLNAPIQGVGNMTSYTFAIPANGAQNVVLAGSDPNFTQGWATMSSAGGLSVRGQGTFRCQAQGKPAFEAVVPLDSPGSTGCIIPFPPSSDPVVLVPFDNTAGYVTSLALANTTTGALAVPIEFDDQAGASLAAGTLNLTAMQHTAFVSTTNYPALQGKKGILRIHASAATLTILGLLSNPSGAFTSILPVTP